MLRIKKNTNFHDFKNWRCTLDMCFGDISVSLSINCTSTSSSRVFLIFLYWNICNTSLFNFKQKNFSKSKKWSKKKHTQGKLEPYLKRLPLSQVFLRKFFEKKFIKNWIRGILICLHNSKPEKVAQVEKPSPSSLLLLLHSS